METCPICNTTADVIAEYNALEAERNEVLGRGERPEPADRDEFLRVGLLRKLRLDCPANHDLQSLMVVMVPARLGMSLMAHGSEPVEDTSLQGEHDHAETDEAGETGSEPEGDAGPTEDGSESEAADILAEALRGAEQPASEDEAGGAEAEGGG